MLSKIWRVKKKFLRFCNSSMGSPTPTIQPLQWEEIFCGIWKNHLTIFRCPFWMWYRIPYWWWKKRWSIERYRQEHEPTCGNDGKLGRHETALSILVHRLHDFAGAGDYCFELRMSSQNDMNGDVYLQLLRLYLEMDDQTAARQQVVLLLKHHAREMDLVKVCL